MAPMISDDELRHLVYTTTVEEGRPPRRQELAARLGVSAETVRAGFARLRERRLLYLSPESGEIAMAPPFAASPTPFLVTVGERSWFANCVWDAYGIAAALHADARIAASCACCVEAMSLEVRDGVAVAAPGVAHFAVPAAHWWDDLPYT